MDRLREILFSGEPHIKAAIALIVSFFSPVYPFLLAMLAMIIFDQYTGRRAAIKRGEAPADSGNIRTLEKFRLYAIAICGAAIIDLVFFDIFRSMSILANPFTMFVSFQIIRYEYKSVIRNVKVVTGANIDIQDALRSVFDSLFQSGKKK